MSEQDERLIEVLDLLVSVLEKKLGGDGEDFGNWQVCCVLEFMSSYVKIGKKEKICCDLVGLAEDMQFLREKNLNE